MTVRDDLERWRRHGWRGVIVDYPPGGDAPASVLRAYDRVRARYGPDLPICFYGESAGGQLALMVAARRHDVACVETAGAPTDLGAIDPRLGALAAHADRNARRAFPGDQLAAASPIRFAGDIRARLLLTHLRSDRVIGVAHAERMAEGAGRSPRGRVSGLPRGARPGGARSHGRRLRRRGRRSTAALRGAGSAGSAGYLHVDPHIGGQRANRRRNGRFRGSATPFRALPQCCS
jgi:acetyl esterase/lipase